ncbi:amino acid transporter [Kumtagia ephedrae]|jgi:uncharacterized protein HemY|uniref:Amino acid transporter n=1 Tax=Kumtagia ephedrae TaxID=2116701 RepID=A0A2P7SDA8_9HYPH|nr:amino acid transporter [Mesorhizobium ephedrae]PSJ60489.1 amino acid transporter [Mesorhizobium ephedrae]
MSLIRNERLKLFATYLNGLAIALFAVGGLAPVFSTLYGTVTNSSTISVVVVSVICLVVSAALHWMASLVLKRLLP